jgi:hypothetical protein
MLGPFDGGERSVAYRELRTSGFSAQFDHIPAGLGDVRDQVEFVRSGSVSFWADGGEGRAPVLLIDVPARSFSEVLRDVDLFTSVPDVLGGPPRSASSDPSQTVEVRADVLRRLLPTLAWPGRTTVLGGWLRVEVASGTWLISLATAAAMRTLDEVPVPVDLPDPLPEMGYLPVDDDILRRVFATVAVLTT